MPIRSPDKKNELSVRNGQQAWRVDGHRLRRATRWLLEELLKLRGYRLAVHLVSGRRMAALNRAWLGHEGPTDVISFDHGEETQEWELHGEIVLCPEVAVDQARRYGTARDAELLRYLVHGVLHLRGYDDREPGMRRRMKRREDRLLRMLLPEFRAGHGPEAIDFRRGAGEPCRQS